MNNIKLVLADNDGTLVNDDRVLSERTKRAIEALHEKGILFGLASGRSYDDMKSYPEKWGLKYPVDVFVCINGSELYDGLTGERYLWNFLDRETIREILELVIPYGANPTVHDGVNGIIWRMDEHTRESLARNKGQHIRVAQSMEEMLVESIPKIMVRMPVSEMPAFEEFLSRHPSDKWKGYKTQPFVYEFVNAKTEKSFAIKQFCHLHDMDLQEIMSFGDTSNDNSMLECTYGVCMANGTPDTKAIAREITEYTNNEDGLAIYLENTLLKED